MCLPAYVMSGLFCKEDEYGKNQRCRDHCTGRRKNSEEFLTQIEEKNSGPFKITYADKDALYIARGYGEQKTSGYSIEVKECYETENAIYIHTNLIGPSKEEKIVEAKTFPYVAVKMQFIDKNVVFE